MRKGLVATFAVAAVFGGPGAGAAWADFVCPVLPVPEQAKDNSNAGFVPISGGDTTVLPGKAGDAALSPVSVPSQATNQNGAGSPGGAHASPGDAGYSAVWNTP